MKFHRVSFHRRDSAGWGEIPQGEIPQGEIPQGEIQQARFRGVGRDSTGESSRPLSLIPVIGCIVFLPNMALRAADWTLNGNSQKVPLN